MKPFPDGFCKTALNPRSSKLQYEGRRIYRKAIVFVSELVLAKLKLSAGTSDWQLMEREFVISSR